MPDTRYPPPRRFSAPTITTASTLKEARRVLDWQRDVALSISASAAPTPSPRSYSGSSRSRDSDRPSSYGLPATYPSRDNARLPRRDTVDNTGRYDEGQVVKGMSNQALFGTLLGAAAGAAFAYALVRDEEPERSGKEREQERRTVVRYYGTAEKGGRVVEVEAARPRSKVSSRARPSERDYSPQYFTKYSVVEAGDEEDKSEARPSGSPKSKAKSHRPLAILPRAGEGSRRSEVSRRSEASTAKPRMMERSMTEVVVEEEWSRKVRRSTDVGERRPMRRVPESVVPSDSVSNSGSGSRREWSERDREMERMRIRQRFER